MNIKGLGGAVSFIFSHQVLSPFHLCLLYFNRTLHAAWTTMRSETEKQGIIHLKLANELEAQIEKQTKDFRYHLSPIVVLNSVCMRAYNT